MFENFRNRLPFPGCQAQLIRALVEVEAAQDSAELARIRSVELERAHLDTEIAHLKLKRTQLNAELIRMELKRAKLRAKLARVASHEAAENEAAVAAVEVMPGPGEKTAEDPIRIVASKNLIGMQMLLEIPHLRHLYGPMQ